jgi:hypothetical protein
MFEVGEETSSTNGCDYLPSAAAHLEPNKLQKKLVPLQVETFTYVIKDMSCSKCCLVITLFSGFSLHAYVPLCLMLYILGIIWNKQTLCQCWSSGK